MDGEDVEATEFFFSTDEALSEISILKKISICSSVLCTVYLNVAGYALNYLFMYIYINIYLDLDQLRPALMHWQRF